MAKDRKEVICNGRAALYAILWNDIRNAAMDCGWAVALHGSLNSDIDIMAMKWVEDCTDAETMINTIIERCFGDSVVTKYGTLWVRNKKHTVVCV